LIKADTAREYPARPVVGVGAVIIVAPGQAVQLGWTTTMTAPGVVLVKRRFEPLAGEWSLPGGKVESGETLEAATAREIAEETGLVVDVGPLVEVLDRIFREDDGRVRFHYVLIDYLCRARGGRVGAGSDVSDVTIADPRELAPFGLASVTRDVIEKAVRLESDTKG
jgi:ADP-ribose pyrophosphatase YjhB (NUDIX family)